MLEWFLLICEEDALTRSINLCGRNHPTLCFWLRRVGRKMSNTRQLLYRTDKSSPQRCSIKEAGLENFTVFTGKYLCWSFQFQLNRILQHMFFKTPMLKNIWLRLLLSWLYEVIVWNFDFGQSLSKPSWLSNTTKKTIAFKPIAADKKDSFKLTVDYNASACINVIKICSC